MPLLVFMLVILLPAMEVYLLFSWIGDSPVAAVLYLIISSLAGLGCLSVAKAGLRELLAGWRARQAAGDVRVLLVLGKLWLIGALLLFPGYLSDILALGMLLLVRGGGRRGDEADGGGVIEARGRLIDDD